MTKRKKIIILVSMALLLVATTALNIYFSLANGKTQDTAGEINQNFFADLRTDKRVTRDEIKLMYEQVMASTEANSTEWTNAKKSYDELIQIMDTESILEGVIKANGFEDAIVTISQQTGNVQVIVRDAGFEEAKTLQIINMIRAEKASLDPDLIRVVPL